MNEFLIENATRTLESLAEWINESAEPKIGARLRAEAEISKTRRSLVNGYSIAADVNVPNKVL